jgi:hypothetical protein
METWFLLPFASEEKGLGDEVKGNRRVQWKVVSSSPFVKLAFARIPPVSAPTMELRLGRQGVDDS